MALTNISQKQIKILRLSDFTPVQLEVIRHPLTYQSIKPRESFIEFVQALIADEPLDFDDTLGPNKNEHR